MSRDCRIPMVAAVLALALGGGCTSDKSTGPQVHVLSGHVIVTGFLVDPAGDFRGTRVVGDVDGVVVKLYYGTDLIARTTTVDGVYRFTGLAPGGYAVSAYVSRTVRDTSQLLTIIRSDLLVGDTLRLNSRGDLYPVPNPAFPTTRIYFDLREEAHVFAAVLDVSGQPLRTLLNQQKPAGLNSMGWLGDDSLGATVPSGVYWVTLEALGEVRTHALFR